MVGSAGEWQWSSYSQALGIQQKFDWFAVDPMLLQFSHSRALATKQFEEFVANGVGQSVWDKVSHKVFLGGEVFVEKHQQRQETLIGDLSEIPFKQRRSPARSLDEYSKASKSRNMAMCGAYSSGAYTLKEIAQYINVHYSTVSRAVE